MSDHEQPTVQFLDEVPEDDPKLGKYEKLLAPCVSVPGKWLPLGPMSINSFHVLKNGKVRLPDGLTKDDFEFKKVRKNDLPRGQVRVFVCYLA